MEDQGPGTHSEGWSRSISDRVKDILGVTRPTFYDLMEKHEIRQAKDLTREEIEEAAARHEGRLDDMAADLEVSRKALQGRMKTSRF